MVDHVDTPVAEEAKEKQVINTSYRGVLIKGSELHKVEPGSAVQRLCPADERPQLDKFSKCKIPQFFILEKVDRQMAGKIYVHYRTAKKQGEEKFKKGATFVTPEMDFKILTGKVGKIRVKNYETHRTTNLDQYVPQVSSTLGTDPEIFITNGKGELIPAFKFLKEKSTLVETPYYDGFQAEFTTQAGSCLAYLCDSVQRGLARTLKEARDHDKSAKLSIYPVYEVSLDYLKSLDKKYSDLGCAPSENIYGLKGKLEDPTEIGFRFAGGHIHIGTGKLQPEQVNEIVRSIDHILGIACVSLFAEYDNPIRRQFYGLPGEFRLPKHGLEYRTLSNAWLIHPVLMHLVFDLSRKACSFGFHGLRKYFKSTEEETIDIIINSDVEKAREVMERNKSIYLGLLKACYNHSGPNAYETAYDVFYKGVDSVIKEPENMVKNWSLDGGWVTHSGNGKCWSAVFDQINKGKKI